MEVLASCTRQVPLLLALATLLVVAANGQMSSPCTASMISSFTPCINFITNSSANGTAPTADCCNALKSLTGGSMDCACLLVTGNIPFQLPINRTLAISLPRACNTPGVPLQCKAAGAPMPAPGPSSLSPTSSPSLSPAVPTIPTTTSPAVSPATDDTPAVGPATPTADSPAATTETRPNVTPSAANPSHRTSSSLLLFGLGLLAAALNYY